MFCYVSNRQGWFFGGGGIVEKRGRACVWKVDVSDFRILLVMLYDPKVFRLASLLRLLLKTSLEKIVRVRILWASFFLSIMKLSCPCHGYF